jgi:hypothetical protein
MCGAADSASSTALALIANHMLPLVACALQVPGTPQEPPLAVLLYQSHTLTLEAALRCCPHVLLTTPPGLARQTWSPATAFSPVGAYLSLPAHFLMYQLLVAVCSLHERGVSHGAISAQAMHLIVYNSALPQKAPPALWLVLSELCQQPSLPQSGPPLRWVDMHRQWQERTLSNFQYLMWLNQQAGRREGDPELHPILPWLIDFTMPNGVRRDLTKSKFRLTKGTSGARERRDLVLVLAGDEQLDQTFQASKADRRHHVSDTLNLLSYYTYKARRVPVCQNASLALQALTTKLTAGSVSWRSLRVMFGAISRRQNIPPAWPSCTRTHLTRPFQSSSTTR